MGLWDSIQAAFIGILAGLAAIWVYRKVRGL